MTEMMEHYDAEALAAHILGHLMQTVSHTWVSASLYFSLLTIAPFGITRRCMIRCHSKRLPKTYCLLSNCSGTFALVTLVSSVWGYTFSLGIVQFLPLQYLSKKIQIICYIDELTTDHHVIITLVPVSASWY
jgi:hypothetical protein